MTTIIKTFQSNRLDFALRVIPAAGHTKPLFAQADRIWCELSDIDGKPLTRLLLWAAHPDADWANGVLVVSIGPTDATRDIGTVTFAITAESGEVVSTYVTGDIVVEDRPAHT